jgi:hypothetical protein
MVLDATQGSFTVKLAPTLKKYASDGSVDSGMSLAASEDL